MQNDEGNTYKRKHYYFLRRTQRHPVLPRTQSKVHLWCSPFPKQTSRSCLPLEQPRVLYWDIQSGHGGSAQFRVPWSQHQKDDTVAFLLLDTLHMTLTGPPSRSSSNSKIKVHEDKNEGFPTLQRCGIPMGAGGFWETPRQYRTPHLLSGNKGQERKAWRD